ncbi:MAG: hypothetical protein ACFE9I_01240 [Candidatus Hermodarchaeota archaeon]
MDTGMDFLRPEFLNILFFQQKNLVIFPYIDMKHLRSLEIFGEGYNIVDLESTALHNLKEIIEFEKSNSYSQNPTLFFIYNARTEKVKEIIQLEGIRCIINSNENVSNLANGSTFIFFNKKSGQFLNYDVMDSELEFEKKLCSDFDSVGTLQDRIHKIKIVALRIFEELNQVGNLENLANILSDYDKKYWHSIIAYTSQFYKIDIPKINSIRLKPRTVVKDFSEEYETIVSKNKQLGKEFILLMHDYREKKVNPAHLELEELYMPQKLYNYLRNHHWKEGIPIEFIQEWARMKVSGYTLLEEDRDDLHEILKKLEIYPQSPPMELPKVPEIEILSESDLEDISVPMPSPTEECDSYIQWIFTQLNNLEHIIDNIEKHEIGDATKLEILGEIENVLQLIGINTE